MPLVSSVGAAAGSSDLSGMTGAEAKLIWMVDVLVNTDVFAVVEVNEAMGMEVMDVEIAVGRAVEKDGGRVKSRRIVQVSESSPYV